MCIKSQLWLSSPAHPPLQRSLVENLSVEWVNLWVWLRSPNETSWNQDLNPFGLRRDICKSSELKAHQVMGLLYLHSYFPDMAMKLCCRVFGSRRGEGCKRPPLDLCPGQDGAQRVRWAPVRIVRSCFSIPVDWPGLFLLCLRLSVKEAGDNKTHPMVTGCFDNIHTFLPHLFLGYCTAFWGRRTTLANRSCVGTRRPPSRNYLRFWHLTFDPVISLQESGEFKK